MRPFANMKLPNLLSAKRLLILKSRVLAGDAAAKEELVLGHVRVAFSIAGRYTRRGADSEDMTSAALEGVVSAVDKIANGAVNHDNLTGYICAYVHRYCTDFIGRNSSVPTPRGQERRVTQTLPDTVAAENFNTVAFDDMLEQIIQSDFEQLIVDLRRQGCTDQEVADKLDVSCGTVRNTRHKLFNRYRSLNDV